jgi:hypothetical protein
MVMTGVYAALLLSFRYQRKLSDSVDTFQQALLASTRMAQALGTGAQSSLVIEPEGFAFVSAQPVAGPFTHDPATGRLEWHKFMFFYLEGESLYRGEVDFPPTAHLPGTPPLASLKGDATARRHLVAEGVIDLSVTAGSGATTKLKLRGEDERHGNSTQLESRVTFRQ